MRVTPLLVLALFATSAPADEFRGNGLDALAPLVGKVWVGEDTNAASGEKTVSVEQWEWILGGKAVRVTQSVNDGELGIQYTYFIDPLTHALAFQSVSTLGGYSKGTVIVRDGKMIRHENVIGSPPVTDVTVTATLSSDGTMKTSSEYFAGRKRIPGGHEYQSHVDANAKINFRSNAK
jgi:hypothetical protein